MTKAWNVVSHRLIKRLHAKLNSVRAAAHIDYGFSLERRLFYTGRFQRNNANARDRGQINYSELMCDTVPTAPDVSIKL